MLKFIVIGIGNRSVFFGRNEAVSRLEVAFVVWRFGKVLKTCLTNIIALWSSPHKNLAIQISADYVLIRSAVNLASLVLRNGPSTHLIILPCIEGKRLHMILLGRAKSIF